MNENASPDDPLGPPVLDRAVPVTARNQALAGRDPRLDVFITTTTTVSVDSETS